MRDQPVPGLSLAARSVLRDDEPSRQELDAAYRRWARKPQQRAPVRLVSRWLIAGLTMGLGIAFGAEAVVERLSPTSRAVPATPSAPFRVASKATLGGAARERAQDAPEPATSAVDAPPPRARSSAFPKIQAVDPSEPAPADSAVWAQAAQGLRDDDFAKTETALATLEHAGSVADREVARLIRAQLMLHQGDTSGAHALLQDLANNAQAAQVRAKARSLLAKSSMKSNSALSAAGSGT